MTIGCGCLLCYKRKEEKDRMEELKCEVCNKNTAIGVASVPGVAYSAAYCTKCLAENAHPYGIVVANTACIGGYDQSADWWREIINDTLKYLGKTREQFDADVAESIKEFP